jgi:peptidoglycan/LPS O-acetylase OafA/YrhL
MFFVLTGFLISFNLLKLLNTNQISTSALQNFWVKRLVRTYPLYLFMLLSLGFFYFQSANTFPVSYINYFVYIQNFSSPHPNFYPELWSLAVQEWFYFLFPIVLYIIGLLNIKNKKLLAFCFIFFCILFITIFRISKINSFNFADTLYWDLNLRKQVVTRLDSLLYGFMMAYILLYHADFFKKYANSFLVLGCFILVADKNLLMDNWFYTNYLALSVAPIGSALLLPFFYSFKFNWQTINKAIFQLSSISYAMYLVHLTPIMLVMLPDLTKFLVKIFPYFKEHTHIFSYVMYWLLTLLFATILHHFIAKPISQFLLRKYYSRKAG